MAAENVEATILPEESMGTVMDSSTQGAQMLIRLKEGSSCAYTPIQLQGSELKKVLVDQSTSRDEGDIAPEECDGKEEIPVTAPLVSQVESTLTSVAVQANDYEIERRSGLVPARRRLIPYKFRDFKNPEEIDEEDPEDEDYYPEEAVVVKKPRKPQKPGARPVGRPRKTRNDHAYDKADELKEGEAGEARSISAQTGSNEEEKTKRRVPQGFPRRGRPPKDDPNTQPKIFKCLQCDKKFSLKGNLKVHMRTHSDERPFKCDVDDCKKSFRSNESLRRHTLAHQGIKLFGCDFCQKRFASNVGLKEHIARHTDTKGQICHVCQRAFRQVSCLRRHLLTHSKEQPHECQVCGKRFSQMVYLRSHVRSHTGERPFRCKTCGKAFAHQSDVARHMHIHLGTKPFVCEVCGARFSDPSTRRRHVREHNGFKPYTCQLCGDSFKRSGQLKAHLNKKHMNYKEEVLITKEGPFNSLQFQFKGNKNTGVAEQLQAEHAAAMNPPQYLQVTSDTGNQEVIALDSGHEAVQLVDENGQIQQVQVQRVRQVDMGGQVVLGQIQQQLVQAGINQSQLDGNQIILAQTNSESREELLEETQRIIQQIQSQLEPAPGTGEEGGQQVKVAYHILHDDDNQQIVEIQYHPVGEGEEQVQDGVLAVIDEGHTSIQGPECQVADEGSTIVQNAGQIEIQSVELADGTIHELRGSSDIVETGDNTQENHHVQMEQANAVEQCEQTELQTVQHVEVLQTNQQTHYVEYQEVEADEEHSAPVHTDQNQVVSVEHHSQKEVIVEQAQHYSMTTEEQMHDPQAHETGFHEESPAEDPASNPQHEEDISQASEEPVHESRGAEEGTVLTFETLEQQQQAASVDYVTNPDFNCQEYYNWLSSFTELCKLVPVPLGVELFQKISQVHKTLSDVLATPRGILTNKDNFRTLMNISKELNGIINEHLSFVLQQLDTDMDIE